MHTKRRQRHLAAKRARRAKNKSSAIVLGEDRANAPDDTELDLEFFTGWQSATVATIKDAEESVRVGRLIRAIPKLCWRNARRVVQQLRDYVDASYLEGIACLDGGILIEHGWLCREDGTLIDPTLPAGEVVYFPGLEFHGRAGIRTFLETPRGSKCKDSFFLFAFGWGGRNSPGMNHAWELGWAYLRERWPEAFTGCESVSPGLSRSTE
jgi:hypothetical protein